MPRKLLVLSGSTALLAVTAAIALLTAYRTEMTAETSCRALRTSLLAVLNGGIDGPRQRAQVHKELSEFQRSCALTDPEARAVFAAFDRAVLFAADPDAARFRPAGFGPPPPQPPFFDPQGGPGGPSRRMRERPFGT